MQLLTLKNPDLLCLQENWTRKTDPTKPLQKTKLKNWIEVKMQCVGGYIGKRESMRRVVDYLRDN